MIVFLVVLVVLIAWFVSGYLSPTPIKAERDKGYGGF